MTRQAMSRGHDYQKLMEERCQPISADGMGSLQGVTAQQKGAKHRRVNAAYKSLRLGMQCPGVRSTWPRRGR